MPMTVADITHNADAFRRAYPHWPHAEPESGEIQRHACGCDFRYGYRDCELTWLPFRVRARHEHGEG